MPIRYSENGRVLTAKIVGDVDHHAARKMMADLNSQLDMTLPKELRLDMKEVTFMDSSGIALVLRAWKRMTQMGGATFLCSIPPQSEKVLKAAGVNKLIPFTN